MMEGGFGLYVHWPFCQAKCPYCDFNSHVAGQIDVRRWADAYVKEITRASEETQGTTLETIFFGGGTPSLMEPDLVGEIIDQVRRCWPMTNDPEISLEANPTSVEYGRFQEFRQAGINRVSMGIQALNDADLRRLGRLHSVEDAKRAFSVAQKAFDRVSFDLIYARQDQSLEDWQAELSEALQMQAGHMSLYQLTIEPGTAFGARFAAGSLRGLPNDDLSADMYLLTQELTAQHGLLGYETSNHARAGSESRHNLIYWRGGSWVGVGPGAHGRLNAGGKRIATETYLDPSDWLTKVENFGTGESARIEISAVDRATEYLMMSLRLSEGSDLGRLEKMGLQLPADEIDRLEKQGFVSTLGARLKATETGKPLLNAILRSLLT